MNFDPNQPQKRNNLGPLSPKKVLLLLAVVIFGCFIAYDIHRKLGSQPEVGQEASEEVSQEEQEEAVIEVLEKLGTIYALPEEMPTVATIVNVEELRKQNPFYNKAKNGDHLIVTRERAILFDAERTIILDVVPVQVRQETPQAASSSSAK